VPGGELAEGGSLDRRDSVDVEVGESFQSWELGVVDAAGAAAFAAVVDLGREHLGQVGQVRLPLAGRDLRQASGLRADGWQVQLASRGTDRCLCCRVNRRRLRCRRSGDGHVPLPISSWS
jgi:hypothetical protein